MSVGAGDAAAGAPHAARQLLPSLPEALRAALVPAEEGDREALECSQHYLLFEVLDALEDVGAAEAQRPSSSSVAFPSPDLFASVR